MVFFSLYNLLSCSISNTKVVGSSNLFREVNFDGCEYYQIEYGIGEGSVYRLIHKDNCKNHSKWIKSGNTNKLKSWPYSIKDSISHFEWAGLGSTPN